MSNFTFFGTNSSCDKILKALETYLDENQSLIPHTVHCDLVALFDNLNDDLANLIETYENKIEEIQENA